MKALYLATALAAATIFGMPAQAAPAAGGALVHTTAPIVLAQYHRSDRRSHRSYRHRPPRHSYRYVPGRRYRSAPHGWHRYSRRPGNWRTRGCILVGPLWFCP